MTLEQALAAKKIAQLLRQGFGRQVAVPAATHLLVSQGFGREHSARVAAEMYELLA